MKHRIIFIALALVTLSGCGKKNEVPDKPEAGTKDIQSSQETAVPDKYTSHIGQTGVLIRNTTVTYFEPNDHRKYKQTAGKGALVLILEENKNNYHVQFAVTELPVLAGYVNKKSVSFDANNLQNATSGLARNVDVYKSPKDTKPKITGYSSAVLIEGKEGNFLRCSLPGGNSGYIKREDINYIVEKADWTVEMLPPEQ